MKEASGSNPTTANETQWSKRDTFSISEGYSMPPIKRPSKTDAGIFTFEFSKSRNSSPK